MVVTHVRAKDQGQSQSVAKTEWKRTDVSAFPRANAVRNYVKTRAFFLKYVSCVPNNHKVV